MAANREYKDSVFTTLFSEKSKLLEVYNAVQGTSYGPDTAVEINTLSDLTFESRNNDISFCLDNKFVILMEHQSTINENMPVRMLFYLSALYEQLLSGQSVYRKRRIPLPAPEFIVLYNGTETYPLETQMRLSDAYPARPGVNSMDLTVKVVNINYGTNNPVLERSGTLKEYSEFVEVVRQLKKQGASLEAAIRQGIAECERQGILREFLKEHAGEVFTMLHVEWKLDEALKVTREEGIEEGWEKGRVEGREEGIEEGWEKGHVEGREEGIEEGWEKGQLEIIRKLIGFLDAETIAEKTGIPIDKILKIEKEDTNR